jgi:hypothetical protein
MERISNLAAFVIHFLWKILRETGLQINEVLSDTPFYSSLAYFHIVVLDKSIQFGKHG